MSIRDRSDRNKQLEVHRVELLQTTSFLASKRVFIVLPSFFAVIIIITIIIVIKELLYHNIQYQAIKRITSFALLYTLSICGRLNKSYCAYKSRQG